MGQHELWGLLLQLYSLFIQTGGSKPTASLVPARCIFLVAGALVLDQAGTPIGAEFDKYLELDCNDLGPAVDLPPSPESSKRQSQTLAPGATVEVRDWSRPAEFTAGPIVWTVLKFDDVAAQSLEDQTIDNALLSILPCPATNASACACPIGPATVGCPGS